jgi:hypothetical protein
MRAAAHDRAFAKRIGIPQKVAKEYVQADKRKKRTGLYIKGLAKSVVRQEGRIQKVVPPIKGSPNLSKEAA